MDTTTALNLLQIPEEEASSISVVSLSRKYGKLVSACEDETQSEALKEAFDFLKSHIIELKEMQKSTPLDHVFPTVVKGEDLMRTVRSAAQTSIITVDDVALDSATALYKEEHIPVIVTPDLKAHDTAMVLWDGHLYDTEVIIYNISGEEYKKRVGNK